MKGVFPIEAKHLDTVGPMAKDIAHVVQGMDLLQDGFATRYRSGRRRETFRPGKSESGGSTWAGPTLRSTKRSIKRSPKDNFKSSHWINPSKRSGIRLRGMGILWQPLARGSAIENT